MICADLAGVRYEQSNKLLFEGLDLTIARGDRVAVVGVNGSGKTTLLRLATGDLQPDDGVVRFGRGVRITMLGQDPVLPRGTVGEVLGDRWEVAAVATSLGVQPLPGSADRRAVGRPGEAGGARQGARRQLGRGHRRRGELARP